MSSNWHTKHLEERSFADRTADLIADVVGSWPFVFFHIVWFAVWIGFALNIELLTLIVSLEAIFLTTLVLMSQNRQEERDHAQAEADYETNIKAKEEIEDLQQRLARIENDKLDKILTLLERK